MENPNQEMANMVLAYSASPSKVIEALPTNDAMGDMSMFTVENMNMEFKQIMTLSYALQHALKVGKISADTAQEKMGDIKFSIRENSSTFLASEKFDMDNLLMSVIDQLDSFIKNAS